MATSLTYDECGRIFKITADTKTTQYTYDQYGQLVREDNQALAKSFVYEYNDHGCVTAVKAYNYTTGDLSGTPVTTTFGYDRDKLTSFSGAAIAYNAMGCPTTYDGKVASWVKGKLSTLSKGSKTTGLESYGFAYNAYGQRVSKSYSYLEGTSGMNPVVVGQLLNSSKQFYYDHSGRLIAETSTKNFKDTGAQNERVVFLYDGNTVIGMQHTVNGVTTPYYFHRNPLGDVIGIYNTSGALVAKYHYDAWGNCTITNETTNYDVASANPIRYRGYYYDEDTGLYYCNARYYSPKWRRFISPDDTSYLDPESVNGLNQYCYCGNDPVNRIDPSGYSWESFWSGVGDWFSDNWAKLAIGATFIIVGAVITFFTAGMGTAGLIAAGGALAASAKAVGISMAVSAGLGAVVGGITGGWEGALQGFGDGLADGFMWGGIFAGSAQILGGASKLLANRNVRFSDKTNWLFGNRNSQSTTLLRVNKAGKQLFRIDADITHLWHLHFGQTSAAMRIHRTSIALLSYLGTANFIKGIWSGF